MAHRVALLAPVYLHQAEIHDAQGEVEKDIDYYTRFTDRGAYAEPRYQPLVEEGRERIAPAAAVAGHGRSQPQGRRPDSRSTRLLTSRIRGAYSGSASFHRARNEV